MSHVKFRAWQVAARVCATALVCTSLSAFADDEVLSKLRAIPRMKSVSELPSDLQGTRRFMLKFEQPVDHAQPGGAKFVQRFMFRHRSTQSPTVFFASGYELSSNISEITPYVAGNQLTAEYRFFGSSVPAATPWDKLTIRQASDDFHDIAQSLQSLYTKPWIRTGRSKGGAAMVHYERYYPADAAGTVAYVAPAAIGAPDRSYLTWYPTLGPADCHAKVNAFAREVLIRRQSMAERYLAQVKDAGETLTWQTADYVIEGGTRDLVFAQWQYGGTSTCADVPDASASDEALFQYLSDTAYLIAYDDQGLAGDTYLPYYCQAATELGFPAPWTEGFDDLIRYRDYGTDAFAPAACKSAGYRPWSVRDVTTWVATQGTRHLFVYGEWDPWSGHEFSADPRKDNLKFTVSQGNHSSSISKLAVSERSAAIFALRRWTGANTSQQDIDAAVRELSKVRADQLEENEQPLKRFGRGGAVRSSLTK
ncbi:hypothetical protein ACS5PN_26990 [Roseateles sp. NT4]|uniref:hypothetical protein n=1 Tax=Roseateles sp. NT4 TaxID=3453715 RepID=UPI003EEB37ED